MSFGRFGVDPPNQIRNVKSTILPKEFRPDKLIGKDMAILLLQESLNLGDAVRKINLPPENYIPPRKAK